MKVAKPAIDLPDMEREIIAQWKANNTFHKSNDRRKGQKEYNFYDGPPFANGLPHYGHMLGQTLKDIVPRYWNMRGFYVERRFGWDCHGLPVEYDVEKKLNLNGRKDILELGVAKFNEACRESVFHYANEWKGTITRLGRWVDWERQYRTMDRDFMESVWWVLKQLYEKGLVYKDHKVVAYSPRITAVVSNFEANLNYKDTQDPSVSVKFKAKDEDAYFIAWTTTPWTLISNLALVVNPQFSYVKIKDHESGELYYLAEERLEFLYKPQKKNKELGYEIVERVLGQDLAGRNYEPMFPYFAGQENAFKILVDDYVSLDSGTGIVHCAPAYGEEDFRVCKANNIDLVDPIDDEACYTDAVPEYKGRYIKDADKDIIKRLKEESKMLRHDTLVHSYPHCDRTEDPLIYRVIPTWYVAVEKIKEQMVANNQKINWLPEHLKNGRMGKWLENSRDWAISRNRFWGTPLPVWVSDKDESIIEVIGSVTELEEKSGVKVDDLHKHFIDDITWPCKKTGGTMRRIPEVFDCWFESGSMPYAQNHYPFKNKDRFDNIFPADFIAEGLDQTRGWFYTLGILSTALFDQPAFKNVVVNGIVLAADGKKMSKRLKNYTAPDQLLDRFGADSVRLYMVNSSVLRGDDLKFSDEGVKDTTRAVLLPLWNAYSFLTTYAQADGWSPKAKLLEGQVIGSKNELDLWILSRLQTLKKSVHHEMEAYRIYRVVPQVIEFIDELTNWYIRLSRRRFWGGSGGVTEDSRCAYETLFSVMSEFVKVFAPFAPFISERIYQGLTEGLATASESVHLCDMPMSVEALIDESLESRMSLIRRTVGLGRSLRAKHQIRTRQVLPSMMVISHDANDKKHIERGMDILKEELNVKELNFTVDEISHVRLSVRPNLKTLGRRLGKHIKALRNHFEELNNKPQLVADLLADLSKEGSVDILGHRLEQGDFLIDRGPKDDRLIATEEGITVLLDTNLTPELLREGLSREVVNRIQKLRKDSGLDVSDRITLQISTDGVLAQSVTEHQTYIGAETLAVGMSVKPKGDDLKGVSFRESFDIEGHQCMIGFIVAQ